MRNLKMIYNVRVWAGSAVVAEEVCYNMDEVSAVEALYPETQGYEVDVTPDTKAYLRLKSNPVPTPATSPA